MCLNTLDMTVTQDYMIYTSCELAQALNMIHMLLRSHACHARTPGSVSSPCGFYCNTQSWLLRPYCK